MLALIVFCCTCVLSQNFILAATTNSPERRAIATMSRYSSCHGSEEDHRRQQTPTTEETLGHAASYRQGQACKLSRLCRAHPLPALRRPNGRPLHVGIRRGR